VRRELENLTRKTKSARQALQSYRRNIVKRAVHWAMGQDTECIHALEQRCLSAQRHEYRAVREERGLLERRAALFTFQQCLEGEVRRRMRARNDDEALLDYVFQSSTSDCPEHDDLVQVPRKRCASITTRSRDWSLNRSCWKCSLLHELRPVLHCTRSILRGVQST
jgi:hypothetical protein